MASANPQIAPATGESMDSELKLQDMQRLQARFAEEAINFLLVNAQLWDETLDLTLIVNSAATVVFTHEVGRAINTIAYIQRIGYRNKFKMVVPRIKDAGGFEHYIMNYIIQKTDDYFYNFLAWVAFTFDFTIFCLKAGKDFVDEGRECIAKYPDLEYFHSRGGWDQLLEYSKYMADLYEKMSSVICRELPSDDVILPIMTAIELLEWEERNSGNRWNPVITNIQQMREVRKRLSYKYEVMPPIDPRQIKSEFEVQIKMSPIRPKSLKDSPKAAEMLEQFRMKPKSAKDEIDDLVEIIEKTRIAVELTHRSPESGGKAPVSKAGEISDSKYVFIVNERFLEEKSNRSKTKRCLKVYSPSKQTEKLALTLNEILDENIANKNYSKLDDVYAIFPPGSDIVNKTCRLIVLDISSEEENDYVNIKEVDEEMIKYVKKCKNRLNQKDGATVGETAKDGMPSDHTASSQLPEHECNLMPNRTEALSKSKMRDIPAKSEADFPKAISTVQSKVSVSNSAGETLTKKQKKKSRRRKHNW